MLIKSGNNISIFPNALGLLNGENIQSTIILEMDVPWNSTLLVSAWSYSHTISHIIMGYEEGLEIWYHQKYMSVERMLDCNDY